MLIFDVRAWEQTARRKSREPLFRKRVETKKGTLTFASATELDHDNRRLIIREEHTLRDQSASYTFVMQCWSLEELLSTLAGAGFDRVSVFGAYDDAVPADATDRLVVVCQRS